jgi:hypothetical protein
LKVLERWTSKQRPNTSPAIGARTWRSRTGRGLLNDLRSALQQAKAAGRSELQAEFNALLGNRTLSTGETNG